MKINPLKWLPLWPTPAMMSWFVLAFFVLAMLTILFPDRPWPARSAIFPTWTVGIALVLSVIEIAIAKVPYLNTRFGPKRVLDLGLPDDVDPETVVERSNAAFLWLTAIILGFVLVGFQLTVIVFTFVYMRVMARASLLVSAIYTAASWVLIFVVFEAMISIPWPRPLLLFLWGS